MMKKFSAVTFSFLMCVFILCAVAHAEGSLKSFIELVVSHKHQFVCDENRNRLTDEFDRSIAPRGVSKLARETLYYYAVKQILDSSGQVRYNCRVLAAWALWELRGRGIECKDLTIALYEPKERKIGYHAAVLIPCNTNGVKEWFVCDISAMSEFQETAFVFMELKCYLRLYGKYFRGIMVDEEEYVRCRVGPKESDIDAFIVGRDIVAWLATDGGDVNSAVELLKSQPTRKLRIMSSSRTMDLDSDIVMGVAISYAPDLALKGFGFMGI